MFSFEKIGFDEAFYKASVIFGAYKTIEGCEHSAIKPTILLESGFVDRDPHNIIMIGTCCRCVRL